MSERSPQDDKYGDLVSLSKGVHTHVHLAEFAYWPIRKSILSKGAFNQVYPFMLAHQRKLPGVVSMQLIHFFSSFLPNLI